MVFFAGNKYRLYFLVRYLFCSNTNTDNINMNLKRIFGGVLTLLGIGGLIYTGISIIQHGAHFTTLAVVGVISLLFFYSGINLIKTTADQT
jgi:hypothetical protein